MRMTKVMIIDDSALTRSVLQNIINADPGMQVVGTAIDPIIAAKKIGQVNPDVITLDLEMPRMDGLTFLRKLMLTSPRPVVVIAGNSTKSSHNAIKALEYGAIEIIEKPDISTPEKLSEVSGVICNAIKTASEATLPATRYTMSTETFANESVREYSSAGDISNKLCVIGSSTGGPDLLREIFQSATGDLCGFIVAQHMPAMFTKSFADRLNTVSGLTIKEASSGDYIRNNQVLIIPGDHHGVIKRDSRGYYIQLNREEKVNRHRPSVDVLFNSAAQVAGGKATGILLTGMGDDGARGLLSLRQSGANTIAQSASSCVVFGMPKRAIELQAAQHILATHEIIKRINELKF
ncbi:chemotaxis response regulator protein-glutamate methylesterase [Chryseolinea sp. T2]|uniref:protein-glutamate methylesterase/protein-glutamine glutaminase n=1 Tax=Chryseolinea sp. T2 TaxID=3129255 RepID=UPI00307794DD